jgi:hypothetical protein
MTSLKAVAVPAMVVACVATFGVLRSHHSSRVDMGQEVRSCLAMPGTGLVALSNPQLAGFAARIGKALAGAPEQGVEVEQVLWALRDIRLQGEAYTLRVFPGRRTLDDVCREMGRLMIQRRRLGEGGRKAEVAQCLRDIQAARLSGVPEEDVRAMAREALGRGDLAVSAAAQCRRIDRRLDHLAGDLVEGWRAATQVADVR